MASSLAGRPSNVRRSKLSQTHPVTSGCVENRTDHQRRRIQTPMASILIPFPEQDEPSAVRLTGARITIGRLPFNTVQIIDRTISGFHAELILEEGHYRLHDRGSTNGTFINGEPATDFHLREACRISFGTVECEFNPEATVEAHGESVPTRGEMNSVRQENAELRGLLAAAREEVAALLGAQPVDDSAQVVARGEFTKVVEEREALKAAQLRDAQEIARWKGDAARAAPGSGQFAKSMGRDKGRARENGASHGDGRRDGSGRGTEQRAGGRDGGPRGSGANAVPAYGSGESPFRAAVWPEPSGDAGGEIRGAARAAHWQSFSCAQARCADGEAGARPDPGGTGAAREQQRRAPAAQGDACGSRSQACHGHSSALGGPARPCSRRRAEGYAKAELIAVEGSPGSSSSLSATAR